MYAAPIPLQLQASRPNTLICSQNIAEPRFASLQVDLDRFWTDDIEDKLLRKIN
jgi:hypothetical protein